MWPGVLNAQKVLKCKKYWESNDGLYIWCQALEKQLETLRSEVEQLKGRESQETVPDLQPQLLDLQAQYVYTGV